MRIRKCEQKRAVRLYILKKIRTRLVRERGRWYAGVKLNWILRNDGKPRYAGDRYACGPSCTFCNRVHSKLKRRREELYADREDYHNCTKVFYHSEPEEFSWFDTDLCFLLGSELEAGDIFG